MNTNRDYLADWAKEQDPIQGVDRNRGTDGRGNPSPIEDSIFLEGELLFTNPMIRPNFFTDEQAHAYRTRLSADLGFPVTLATNKDFDTSRDVQGRKAYYVVIDGAQIPLNRCRYLASTGKDANGKQLFDDKTYDIRVDGPGKFTYTAVEEPQEDGPRGFLTFEPARRQ